MDDEEGTEEESEAVSIPFKDVQALNSHREEQEVHKIHGLWPPHAQQQPADDATLY